MLDISSKSFDYTGFLYTCIKDILELSFVALIQSLSVCLSVCSFFLSLAKHNVNSDPTISLNIISRGQLVSSFIIS